MSKRHNLNEVFACKEFFLDKVPVWDTGQQRVDTWAHLDDSQKKLRFWLQVCLMAQHLKHEELSVATLKFAESITEIKDSKALDSILQGVNFIVFWIRRKEAFQYIDIQLVDVTMVDPLIKLRTKFVPQNRSLDKDRSLIV